MTARELDILIRNYRRLAALHRKLADAELRRAEDCAAKARELAEAPEAAE